MAGIRIERGAAPVWVRVTRSGDSVSGSFSYDGVNWVQIGERQNVGAVCRLSAEGAPDIREARHAVDTPTALRGDHDPRTRSLQWRLDVRGTHQIRAVLTRHGLAA